MLTPLNSKERETLVYRAMHGGNTYRDHQRCEDFT